MSESKANPKGLKDQEVEHGSVKKHPPIPYISVVDKVQDALNKSKGKEATFTMKLPDKMEFTVSIWDACSPKAFLNHVQTAINTGKRMGLFSNNKSASIDKDVAIAAAQGFRDAIAKAKVAAGKKKSTKKETASETPLTDLEESLKGALTK